MVSALLMRLNLGSVSRSWTSTYVPSGGLALNPSHQRPVLGAVKGVPVSLQVIGVNIKAVDRIREVGFADTILVQFQEGTDIVPDAAGFLLADHVLQLKALLL